MWLFRGLSVYRNVLQLLFSALKYVFVGKSINWCMSLLDLACVKYVQMNCTPYNYPGFQFDTACQDIMRNAYIACVMCYSNLQSH